MIDSVINMFLLVDTSDQLIIALLCLVCGFILREIMDCTWMMMAGFVLPFFVGAVIMLHVFRQEKILMVGAEEIQVLAAAAVGIATTFILLGALYRIYSMFTDAQIEMMQKARRKAAENRSS